MVDTLKTLLEAETLAESIVAKGEQERDEIIQNSLNDAHDLEQQFQDRLPEIYQSFLDKTQERAEQTVAEMKLRYDERNSELRELATRHDRKALDRAVELIINLEKL